MRVDIFYANGTSEVFFGISKIVRQMGMLTIYFASSDIPKILRETTIRDWMVERT